MYLEKDLRLLNVGVTQPSTQSRLMKSEQKSYIKSLLIKQPMPCWCPELFRTFYMLQSKFSKGCCPKADLLVFHVAVVVFY